jgi:Domain of unknown function (DUF4157)
VKRRSARQDPSPARASAGGGTPLSPELRATLEPRFQHDFGHVRVYADADAQRFIAQEGAAAATMGSDIYLGAPSDSSLESQYLLAHELTHVVQNDRAAHRAPAQRRSRSSDGAEREARDSALNVLAGGSVHVSSAPDAVVACEEPNPFHLSLLPPEMRLRLGPVGLSADTSSANLQLGSDRRGFDAGYAYGGDISAGLHYDGFRANLGVNPGSGALSLGGSYRDFNFGANADIGARTGGFSLGYGAPLPPNLADFSATMQRGGEGLTNLVPALPGALSDPLGFYGAQSGNISAVTSAASTAAGLTRPSGPTFGANLSGNFSPEEQRVMLNIGGYF